MGFKIFDTVNTVYGPGFVKQVRENDYVVLLSNWALAQGQSPTCYLAESSLSLIPGAFPGTTVSTPDGIAKVLKIKPDGKHVAVVLKSKKVLELDPTSITLSQSAGFDVGDEVMTVYGQGYVEAVRATDLVVKLNDWKLAQGQSPTLHLAPLSCVKIPGLKVKDTAKTCWGLVQVDAIHRDGKHVCRALHWNLADGKPPTLYLNPEAFALLSIKPTKL